MKPILPTTIHEVKLSNYQLMLIKAIKDGAEMFHRDFKGKRRLFVYLDGDEHMIHPRTETILIQRGILKK